VVSNYVRIFEEITKEGSRLASGEDISAERLCSLVMAIVDLEDQHRIKSISISKLVADRIEDAAVAGLREGS